MVLAHTTTRTPHYWCETCELALYDYEVMVIELPAEQGCEGATTLCRDECRACGGDVVDYKFQDDIAEAVEP